MTTAREPDYGLLAYETENLGDEIQSLAARQFLPRVDCYVQRERMKDDPWPHSGRLKMILNGWFMRQPQNWPPHEKITPLVTSFHIWQMRSRRFWRRPLSPATAFFSPQNIDFLVRNAPVGARDPATADLLRRNGVEAHYSNCLTLTLPRTAEPREDYIVANDTDDAILEAMRRRTQSPIVVTTHVDNHTQGAAQRLQKAEALLGVYARAKAVVTTRLHCALPCLALGTPVLFIRPKGDTARVSGGLELLNHCTASDFMADRAQFGLRDPPANSTAYLDFRNRLIRACQSFTAAS